LSDEPTKSFQQNPELFSAKEEIFSLIPPAIRSVEKSIVKANRDRGILGVANLFSMLFNWARLSDGFKFRELDGPGRISVTAASLTGYGFWGPFLLAFEDARLDCNSRDLVRRNRARLKVDSFDISTGARA